MTVANAVSIPQPYAWAIIFARLCVHSMPYAVGHRGRVMIHAGFGVTQQLYLEDGTRVPRELVYGAIIGSAMLTNVVRPDHPLVLGRPGITGPYCWIFTDPQPLDVPVPCMSKHGVFQVDAARIQAAQSPSQPKPATSTLFSS